MMVAGRQNGFEAARGCRRGGGLTVAPLKGAVHAFDLPVGHGCLGLVRRRSMSFRAQASEGMGAEDIFALQRQLDLGRD
jgi:hypothetical protein